MWKFVASILLRRRVTILIALGLITLFMGYKATSLKISYGVPKLLSENDSTNIIYQQFRQRYGGESIVYVLGIDKDPLSDLDLFNAWHELGNEISHIKGIDTLVSVANNIFYIKKDVENKKFKLEPIVKKKPETKQELDSISTLVKSLPFFNGRLYSDSTNASLMFFALDSSIFNSDDRSSLITPMMKAVERFESVNDTKVHYTGMAFIRTILRKMVKGELGILVGFALGVTILILFLFFRTFNPVASSVLVVAIGVIWSFGSIPLFGYEVTALTGLIPPLIIVIGVPNCIYLINRYHAEYRKSGNQALALTRMIQKTGSATLMTNLTTAAGFGTFIFTDSIILKEFGVVAAFDVISLFVIAMIIIPTVMSYTKPPKEKHTKHLTNRFVVRAVDFLVALVSYHRKMVYLIAIILIGIGIYGISRMQATGNVVDDLPDDHFIIDDLKWVETNFSGIMPFEVSIDAHKPGYATKDHTLRKIDKLQDEISTYKEFSKPLSIVEGIKFMKQGFYNGNPDKYELINNQEKAFFKPYFDNENSNKKWLQSYVDSTKQYTRVSFSMTDIGVMEMERLIESIRPKVDSIFPTDKYTVNFTGSSLVFLKGTTYLIKNLFMSLLFAIALISIFLSLLFSSLRMIVVSLATNFFPLILTGGIMGFFNIPLKPSTILVFSIAFGISVDDTIHFLAKYRQELKNRKFSIGTSVLSTLRETGASMIYTSIILFFGFSVFISSEFGGTKALGVLVSCTLFIAMLSNLVLLPSLLMTLDRRLLTKAFNEPYLEIYDEEEDIELDKLVIKKEA